MSGSEIKEACSSAWALCIYFMDRRPGALISIDTVDLGEDHCRWQGRTREACSSLGTLHLFLWGEKLEVGKHYENIHQLPGYPGCGH